MQNHSRRIKHLNFFTFLFNDWPCSTIWNLAYVSLPKDASIITQSTAQQHHSQNYNQMLNLLLQGCPEERYVCLFSHAFMLPLVKKNIVKKVQVYFNCYVMHVTEKFQVILSRCSLLDRTSNVSKEVTLVHCPCNH
jgi:Na+/melibiose symporter-like transporter